MVAFCLSLLIIFILVASVSLPGDNVLCLISLLFIFFLRMYSRFDLVWFRLTCAHGWVRSGSANVI